ncbi:MAG TPA: hypothetical protein VMB21_17965 [Candidatus Limnocylindria bacterium]|jgi:hypothetical protein|nr:hypothetical protein [Candidatus Limnocylindria bacterium]
MNLAIIGLMVGGIGLVWLVAARTGRRRGGRWGDQGYEGGESWTDSDSGAGIWPAWLWWNSSSADSPSVFEAPSLHPPAVDPGAADCASPAVDCGSSFSGDGGGFSGDSGGGGGCDCGSGGGDCGGGGGGD